MIAEGALLGFLAVCAVFDGRSRRIPVWIFWVGAAIALGIRFFKGYIFLRTRSLTQAEWLFMALAVCMKLFLDMLPGMICLLGIRYGILQIGEGDGFMLLIAGIFAGAVRSILLFTAALFLMAPRGLFYVMIKGEKKKELPLAPYFLMGELLICLMRTSG